MGFQQTFKALADPTRREILQLLKGERIKRYFPASYTQQQMEDVILSLLEQWSAEQSL